MLAERPKIDRARLLQLAHNLPAAWNAPGATSEFPLTDLKINCRVTKTLPNFGIASRSMLR